MYKRYIIIAIRIIIYPTPNQIDALNIIYPIKTIIKRNKQKEPFSAEKLNGWGIWAAGNLGKYVNWSEVILETVAKLPQENCSYILN